MKIDQETIYDAVWQNFCDNLDSLQKTHSASIVYEPSDEKHYVSFPDGEMFEVEIKVKDVTEKENE